MTRLLAILATTLLLCGCLPESVNPVAPPDKNGGDARLLGAWLHVAEDGYGVFHVFKTDREDWDLILADHDVEGIGGIETYHGHTTRLASGDYLNVLVTGSETGYVILRYEFTDKDHLRMWFSNTDALAAAVTSGALAGEVKEESTGPDVRITATSQQWRQFLENSPPDLFGDPMDMERVGPALVAE